MTGKTIVYLPNWLGDMVMAVPFLHALKARQLDEIWAVGKAGAIHVYNGLDLFDRFISIDRKGLVASLERMNELKKIDFRRAIALPHSFRSALFFYNLQIKERVGYARNKRGFMLTRKVYEASKQPESTVEHYLKIADALGVARSIATPLLITTEDEERRYDHEFPDVSKPYGVFITGAQYGLSKCWPQKSFSELADMIADTYKINIYMLPGKDEIEMAERIRDGAVNKDNLRIKSMNIRDLKVCLSRASFVVSNDTGPRHISAALSVPTIVLMGPMDEKYTDYPSDCTYRIKLDLDCRPCNDKACRRGHECLTGITPGEVLKTIGRVLEKEKPSEKTE